MYITTRAIVLALRQHSDKAMLLSVFTQQGGRRELYVYGAHGKRSQRGQYLPMQPIELTYDEQPGRSIHTLKEARILTVHPETASDIVRSTIALYMAEVLFRTITHPMADETLYRWIEQMSEELEASAEPERIPLRFIEGLNRVMGYDVYGEVREQLKSKAVVAALLEATDL